MPDTLELAFRATDRAVAPWICAYSPGSGWGGVKIAVLAPGKPDEMEYVEAV